MQNGLQITILNMPYSAGLDSLIREKVAKLEKFHPRLTACHVVISAPHSHQQHHRLYAVRMTIVIPGGEVVVTRDDNEDVYVLLRGVFAAAERELGKSMGRRDGRAPPHHGFDPAISLAAQETDHE